MKNDQLTIPANHPEAVNTGGGAAFITFHFSFFTFVVVAWT